MSAPRTYEIQLTAQDDYVVNGKIVSANEVPLAIRKVRHGGRKSYWQEHFRRNVRLLASYFDDAPGSPRFVTFLELHADGLPVYVRADRILAVRSLHDDEKTLCPSRNALLMLASDRDYFVDETLSQILRTLDEWVLRASVK